MKEGAPLGQHFLKNPHYAEVLAREAGIANDNVVLEIGPGEGMLTREILKQAKKVIAIEKDTVLVEKLQQSFAEEIATGKLEVLSADIRDISPREIGLEAGKYIVAANIPYYITGELLRKFLETDTQPKTIAFLMQKEVADRILSQKESILSISVKVYGSPRIAAKVSKGNFNPPPKVDSAILVVEHISKKNFSDVSEEKFFDIVRTGFAAKRKMLANNLSAHFDKEKIAQSFERCGIDAKSRAENLHVSDWFKLAASLAN